MNEKRSIIVGDLGGSFLRIGVLGPNGPENIESISVQETSSFERAIDEFQIKILKHHNISLEGAVFLLSFGRKLPPDARHEFDFKDNKWSFVPKDIEKKYGFHCFKVIHDAQAMGLATLNSRPEVFSLVRGKPVQGDGRSVIMLVGTGVGHAFIDTETHSVFDTHGAHFPPSYSNDDQRDILRQVNQLMLADKERSPLLGKNKRSFIFEDILSGDGLYKIYAAMCNRESRDVEFHDTREMIENPNDEVVRKAAMMYCGFLGLYANIISTVNYAYNSLYICGGPIERMESVGLFDWEQFQNNYIQNMVEIVDHGLKNTPIYRVQKEHTALYGLEVYAQNEEKQW